MGVKSEGGEYKTIWLLTKRVVRFKTLKIDSFLTTDHEKVSRKYNEYHDISRFHHVSISLEPTTENNNVAWHGMAMGSITLQTYAGRQKC